MSDYSTIKYEICGPSFTGTAITPVEVVSETINSLVIKTQYGNRRAWVKSSYHVYFDTWEQARTELVDRIHKRVMCLQIELDVANNNYQELLARVKPT